MADDGEVDRLQKELAEKTAELKKLKDLLDEKEQAFKYLGNSGMSSRPELNRNVKKEEKTHLSNPEISRYSRQLILPEIGVKGQVKLCNTAVLVVGAGGLGCPASLYLAAAGVGCLGIVDYDAVELSNLHRQVLHSESRLEMSKALSAKQTLNGLNSAVRCIPYCMQLNSSNALEIITQYDVVVDATDNVATRYLLNDACVLAGKPLVSGSALRFEGQLTVYNHEGGPCYRCIFPTPPPPETVGNCSDSGVVGAVPGVIGTLQALEVIKIAVGLKLLASYSQKLLMYDSLDGRFLTVKLRPRQPSCAMCGDSPTIDKLQDYEQFCGASATDKAKSLSIIHDEHRITVKEYKEVVDKGDPHILLDVRQPVELEICSLPNSLNIPLRTLSQSFYLEQLKAAIDQRHREVQGKHGSCHVPVYVLCKQGNDSQKAVELLNKIFMDIKSNLRTASSNPEVLEDNTADPKNETLDVSQYVIFKDIKGGLTAWAKQIDEKFPQY